MLTISNDSVKLGKVVPTSRRRRNNAWNGRIEGGRVRCIESYFLDSVPVDRLHPLEPRKKWLNDERHQDEMAEAYRAASSAYFAKNLRGQVERRASIDALRRRREQSCSPRMIGFVGFMRMLIFRDSRSKRRTLIGAGSIGIDGYVVARQGAAQALGDVCRGVALPAAVTTFEPIHAESSPLKYRAPARSTSSRESGSAGLRQAWDRAQPSPYPMPSAAPTRAGLSRPAMAARSCCCDISSSANDFCFWQGKRGGILRCWTG